MQSDLQCFSTRLREHTRDEHTAAETSSFISDLLDGRLSVYDYIRLLAQYQPIYAALESAVGNMRADENIAPILDPGLERSARIEADLHGLVEWAGIDSIPQVLSAAREYADRITHVGATKDWGRLLAHHYLRYLGDLSGGQAIRARAARHYHIPAHLLTMWDFDTIAKPKVFKDGYRDLLDILGPQLGEETMIDEARHGFRYNQQLFTQLQHDLLLA